MAGVLDLYCLTTSLSIFLRTTALKQPKIEPTVVKRKCKALATPTTRLKKPKLEPGTKQKQIKKRCGNVKKKLKALVKENPVRNNNIDLELC